MYPSTDLTRPANLPEGLCVLLALISVFFNDLLETNYLSIYLDETTKIDIYPTEYLSKY